MTPMTLVVPGRPPIALCHLQDTDGRLCSEGAVDPVGPILICSWHLMLCAELLSRVRLNQRKDEP